MKYNLFKILTALLALIITNNANAYFYETENTIEVYKPRIFITANGTGFAQGRSCKECPLMKFKVAPDVQAFNLQGDQVDLREANKWSGKAALFSYGKKTKKLLRITEQRGIEQ